MKELDDSKQHGDDILKEQAHNKRQQENLTQAIDVTGKNLKLFHDGWKALVESYKNVKGQVDHKLACAGERLGKKLQRVKDALEGAIGRIDVAEQTAATDETDLVLCHTMILG